MIFVRFTLAQQLSMEQQQAYSDLLRHCPPSFYCLPHDHQLTVNEDGKNECIIHYSLVRTGTEPIVIPTERTTRCGVGNDIDVIGIRGCVDDGHLAA
jgi:hypothetical protein